MAKITGQLPLQRLSQGRGAFEAVFTYIINVEKVGIVVALRGALRTDPVQLVCQIHIKVTKNWPRERLSRTGAVYLPLIISTAGWSKVAANIVVVCN